MTAARPTANIDTLAEKARRAAIKREIKHIVATQRVGTDDLAGQIDDAGTALVRQLADELAVDGVIGRVKAGGGQPNEYFRADHTGVVADD